MLDIEVAHTKIVTLLEAEEPYSVQRDICWLNFKTRLSTRELRPIVAFKVLEKQGLKVVSGTLVERLNNMRKVDILYAVQEEAAKPFLTFINPEFDSKLNQRTSCRSVLSYNAVPFEPYSLNICTTTVSALIELNYSLHDVPSDRVEIRWINLA